MSQTLSGCILISPWRQWNLLFHHPNALSIVTLVRLCEELNLSSEWLAGLKYGVIKYGLHPYPLSPSIRPSWRDLFSVSNLLQRLLVRKTWLSCVLPGQRATRFVNFPASFQIWPSTISLILYCLKLFINKLKTNPWCNACMVGYKE